MTIYGEVSHHGRRTRSMVIQLWVGGIDANGMLEEIGGWHVGCYNDRQARQAVEFVVARGYVTTRKHYAPIFPEGVDAYEITDAGLEALRKSYGAKAAADAKKTRTWYRRNSSK